jgi:hypothetical protein
MVPNRDFKIDLLRSNHPLLRDSWERLFRRKFGADCLINWQDNKTAQQDMGTDVIVTTNRGRRYSIELKTRNNNCFKCTTWIQEIVSHIYNHEHEPRTILNTKEGWIYSTTAEYIFHGTINAAGTEIIEAIFYSTTPFKNKEYKFDEYKHIWLKTRYDNGNWQLTMNKLVPKNRISEDANYFWEWSMGEITHDRDIQQRLY